MIERADRDTLTIVPVIMLLRILVPVRMIPPDGTMFTLRNLTNREALPDRQPVKVTDVKGVLARRPIVNNPMFKKVPTRILLSLKLIAGQVVMFTPLFNVPAILPPD